MIMTCREVSLKQSVLTNATMLTPDIYAQSKPFLGTVPLGRLQMNLNTSILTPEMY